MIHEKRSSAPDLLEAYSYLLGAASVDALLLLQQPVAPSAVTSPS
jgi:hypothetical protein